MDEVSGLICGASDSGLAEAAAGDGFGSDGVRDSGRPGDRDRCRLLGASSAGIWFRFLDPLTRASMEKEKDLEGVPEPAGEAVVRSEDMRE